MVNVETTELTKTPIIKQGKKLSVFIIFAFIVVFIIAALFSFKWYYHKQYKVGHIEIPIKTIMTISLNTTTGEKQIHRTMIDQYSNIKSTEENYFRENPILSNLIIFKNGKLLDVYDKQTKVIKNISLPTDLEAAVDKGNPFDISIDELNSKFFLIGFASNYTDYGSYLFNKKTYTLIRVTQLDASCGIYCSRPQLVKTISDNEFLLMQEAGDACWSSGKIFNYNLTSNIVNNIFAYTNGCHDTSDSFIGFIDNNIIASKHKWSQIQDINDTYLNLYKISPQGMKTDLISPSNMPKDIKNIWIFGNMIYLSNKTNTNIYSENKHVNGNTYYAYNTQTNLLNEIKSYDVRLPQTIPDLNIDDLLSKNKDFINISISKEKIKSVTEAQAWNTGLRILDTDKDLITLVPTSFLSGKFEAEKTDSRLQPELQGKINVYLGYRISNPKVLSEKLIQFTGAVYYSSTPVQEKNFIMSLDSGNIYGFNKNDFIFKLLTNE